MGATGSRTDIWVNNNKKKNKKRFSNLSGENNNNDQLYCGVPLRAPLCFPMRVGV